ncbi:MAG: chorismate synthase [Chlamydiales bacterium]|nr:chorismate synthase [Chlamydiales bacterium]
MRNSFGQIFRITTWGESHGKAIGVVIDGCPAGLEISEEEINAELARRAPGKQKHTSQRKEPDHAEILSGFFEGKTTGTPISILIPNRDVDTSKYEPIKDLVRPGHANAAYLKKYGIFDWRGGGRASARETACRVAAGAVAKKLLRSYGVHVEARLIERGEIEEGDSAVGVVEGRVEGVPAGLGEPVYQKMEAVLAQAMLSLPASKGFEIGEGFAAARMRGSDHNLRPTGGTLGGITDGEPLFFRVAFKPTSSIAKPQETTTLSGERATFMLPEGSRHDPCVAIRAVPVVESMCALVLADALLMNLTCTINPSS